jgi:hypothetical protein
VAIQLHGSTVFSHHFDLNETTASKLINNWIFLLDNLTIAKLFFISFG